MKERPSDGRVRAAEAPAKRGESVFYYGQRFRYCFPIAAREQKEGFKPPSDPQIFVGNEMAAKLPKLEDTLRARRSGSNI